MCFSSEEIQALYRSEVSRPSYVLEGGKSKSNERQDARMDSASSRKSRVNVNSINVDSGQDHVTSKQ